jgi:Dip2/Utp12 Family
MVPTNGTTASMHNPSKTMSSAPIDKSFEEIIQESAEIAVVPLQRPSASSLTTLLQQALHTNDIILLQQAFMITQPLLIQATLARLPASLLPALLKTLCELLGKPTRITTLLVWFRSLLSTHTSILMTHPALLRDVQLILLARVKNAAKVHMLNGKLNLVLGHTRETLGRVTA